MTEEKKLTLKEAHQAFASGIFNKVWDLLEKKDRSPADDEMMINAAHTSLYHWRSLGQPLNFQRGEWMIAHVYTILSMKECALRHAQICLELTEKHGIGDFDQAFAYEGYARASALNEDKATCEKYYDLAKEAAQSIKKKDDRDYFLKALDEGPWFGAK